MKRPGTITFIFFLLSAPLNAGDVQVAVASNFSRPMQQIAELFGQQTGHIAHLSYGSSGKFVAQISHGAPFEVFLSADADKPKVLLESGLAVKGSNFTYAQGRLVLWSLKDDFVDPEGKVLGQGNFDHIAMAAPRLAPYGEAAREVIEKRGLKDKLSGSIVMGENISQTYQFVKTGNADLGFVALSQVMRDGRMTEGSGWVVPEEYHSPIKQDAVLLNKGKDNAAAKALLQFLKSEQATTLMVSYGYTSVDSGLPQEAEVNAE